MKLLILCITFLLLMACDGSITDSRFNRDKNECFQSGGVEFQYGSSGGSTHSVCVYRKE